MGEHCCPVLVSVQLVPLPESGEEYIQYRHTCKQAHTVIISQLVYKVHVLYQESKAKHTRSGYYTDLSLTPTSVLVPQYLVKLQLLFLCLVEGPPHQVAQHLPGKIMASDGCVCTHYLGHSKAVKFTL